jgi:hypothetical protein
MRRKIIMARPAKYDWERIKLDYESGLAPADLHKKYDIAYNILSYQIKKNGWVVIEQAKSITEAFNGVIEQVIELNDKNPKLAKIAVEKVIDDIGSRMPEYRKSISIIFHNLLIQTDKVLQKAKTASDIVQLSKAVQIQTDSIGVTQRHASSQVNIQNNQNNEQKTVIFKRVTK